MPHKDFRVEFYKSGGPGGQHKNKRHMAVRITHLSTGLVAVAQEYRSQAVNKKMAMERLQAKLEKRNRPVVPRVPTKPSRAAKERKLTWKKKHATKKQSRRERISYDE